MEKKEKNYFNYVKLDYQYLEREDITLLQAVILSYLQSYQNASKYCFEGMSQLAVKFNTPYGTFRKAVKKLMDMELVFKSNDKKYLTPYGNRKVLILVDDNNPLPTKKPVRNAEKDATDVLKEERYKHLAKEIEVLKMENDILRLTQQEESRKRLEELLNNAPRLSDEI